MWLCWSQAVKSIAWVKVLSCCKYLRKPLNGFLVIWGHHASAAFLLIYMCGTSTCVGQFLVQQKKKRSPFYRFKNRITHGDRDSVLQLFSHADKRFCKSKSSIHVVSNYRDRWWSKLEFLSCTRSTVFGLQSQFSQTQSPAFKDWQEAPLTF